MEQVKSFNAFLRDDYQPKVFTEAKSEVWASTPLKDKKHEILTPARQPELRKNIAAASTKDEIMKLIDGAIFGDPDQGEVAPIDLEPTIDVCITGTDERNLCRVTLANE